MKSLRPLVILCCLLFAASAQAQWQTPSYTLKGGWNSIYLHGDATHVTPDVLFAGHAEILEVWRWNPNPNQVQFTTTPLLPSPGTPEWLVWSGGATPAGIMTGQSAFLIKCSGTTANTYTVTIPQRPLPPSANWVRNGANLLGFPTFQNGVNYPSFSNYFATFPAAIAANTKIFKYVGGDLGPSNPIQVYSPSNEKLDRNTAYWFSAEVVGNFYAPLEISLTTNDGLAFGRTGSLITAHVRNRTSLPVTLTLDPVDSEPAPGVGQTGISGRVPLTRHIFNASTLVWDSVPITAAYTEVIGPQSTVELKFGINRADPAMAAAVDAFFASFLRLRDSGNLMDIYLPATAAKGSLAGLWVGDIQLTSVGSRVSNSAQGTATVTDGAVTSIEVVGTGGYGYSGDLAEGDITIAPPPEAVQAEALAASDGDVLTSISITNPGAGYSTAPIVTIAPPPSGTTATAAATVAGGVITSISIDSGAAGSGYTSNPLVTIAAPPAAVPATATATVENGSAKSFTITSGGSGYQIASPKVTVAPPLPLAGTSTPRAMPLRTLLHVADNGTARLLHQVFLGQLAAAPHAVGLCTFESLLKQDAKATAQRLVAAHMPITLPITASSGSVALPGSLTCAITVPFDDKSNPFVHQYHPDHDNKNVRFEPALAGEESYTVTRTCTFTFTATPPPGSTSSSGWGSTVLGGTYTETITGLHKNPIQMGGTFELRRASEDGTLVTP